MTEILKSLLHCFLFWPTILWNVQGLVQWGIDRQLIVLYKQKDCFPMVQTFNFRHSEETIRTWEFAAEDDLLFGLLIIEKPSLAQAVLPLYQKQNFFPVFCYRYCLTPFASLSFWEYKCIALSTLACMCLSARGRVHICFLAKIFFFKSIKPKKNPSIFLLWTFSCFCWVKIYS